MEWIFDVVFSTLGPVYCDTTLNINTCMHGVSTCLEHPVLFIAPATWCTDNTGLAPWDCGGEEEGKEGWMELSRTSAPVVFSVVNVEWIKADIPTWHQLGLLLWAPLANRAQYRQTRTNPTRWSSGEKSSFPSKVHTLHGPCQFIRHSLLFKSGLMNYPWAEWPTVGARDRLLFTTTT